MEFLGNGKSSELSANVSNSLYRALATGDVPAAWLLTKPLLERSKMEKLSASTAFNCGLCLFLLEEYERTLVPLKRAEQFLGSTARFKRCGTKRVPIGSDSVKGYGIAVAAIGS